MGILSAARSIERFGVDSSNLASLGYSGGILSVEFKSGGVYFYKQVPQEIFDALCAAESRGSYFARNIRSKYPAECLTGVCPSCGAQGYIGETCDDCGTADVRAVEKRYKEALRDGPGIRGDSNG